MADSGHLVSCHAVHLEREIEVTNSETTTYEYYDNPVTAGVSLGNLKKVTYPKGNTVEYIYDPMGNLWKTVTCEGDNTYQDTIDIYNIVRINGNPVTVALDRMTGTFNYGNLAASDTVSMIGVREINTRTCNGTLIAKHEFFQYEDYGFAPDLDIAYDDTDVPHAGTYYKIADSGSPFYGKTRLAKNPDGTVTTYAYVRSGGLEITTSCSGKPDDYSSSNCVVVDGTKQITHTSEAGVAVYRETRDIVSNNLLSSETALTFDEYGRVTKTQYNDGTFSEVRYGCCGVEWEKDRNGTETTYAYDANQRLSYSVRDGITTLYTYNANGDMLSQTVKGRENTELTTSFTYDNGRQASSTDPMNHTTSYVAGGTQETTTYPDGSTSTTVYTRGAVTANGGTAVHPVSYQYGPNWQKNVTVDVTTYTNLLGQQYKIEYADNAAAMTYYNAKGQAWKQVSPGGQVSLTEYDDLGRTVKTALDVNKNDTIDADDQVTLTSYSFATRDNVPVRKTETVFQCAGQQQTISVQEQSLDNLRSWTTDLAGRVTAAVTERLGNGNTKTTVTRPDGVVTVTYATNDRATRIENTPGNTVEYSYDEFNRQQSLTEKNGAVVINSILYTYNAAGQVVSQNVNGRTTSFTLDVMGRRTTTAFPGDRTVHYEYFLTGELKKVSGSDTYPQAYTYDDQGRMATLTTYRDSATPEVTAWTYDPRGFLTAKTYADGKRTAYTYNLDGRMLTRLWARGITTTYAYDPAGRMSSITYSDGTTPSISYTYDWMSRPVAITDGTGTHTLSYNADSTLASATIPYIVDHSIAYTYDTLGRRTGMSLKQGNNTLQNTGYTYDSLSRLATVGNGTLTATYTRDPGRNRLASTAIANGSGTVMTVTRQYDQYDRLTSIGSVAGNTTRSYTYTYNDRDQRIHCTMADGSSWTYTYDDKGQVTGGVRKDAQDKAIPGQSFGYAYDDIGNRLTETRGIAERLITYTANNLNQYTRREFKGTIPVLGEADPDTVIKAMRNDTDAIYPKRVVTAERDGKYFKAVFYTNNLDRAREVPYTVYAIKPDPNDPNRQLVQKETATHTVPKAVEPFTYDPDGNMLTMPQGAEMWTLTWTGENRLATATSSDELTKLEFVYDYMGRRVSKQVYTRTATTEDWTLSTENKYVYDGWNCIAIFNTSDVLQKSYLWGMDLSGSLQGAGGVGGLLAVTDDTATYFPMYDGNGNIMTYVNASGTVQADYTYDLFGRTIAQTGSLADIFLHRFSTKRKDFLYDFGLRDYTAELGCWISKDPIEENGEVNLYGFVKNNPVKYHDLLGMDWHISRTGEKWADVCRDNLKNDTLLQLAEKLSLNAGPQEMTGKMGWLRRPSGHFTTATVSDGTRMSYKVPNTILMIYGNIFKGVYDFNKRNFALHNYNVLELPLSVAQKHPAHPEIYGAMLVGHFKDGDFSVSSPRFTANDLKKITGHKISFFVGFGCNSADGKWESVANKNWVTDYYVEETDIMNSNGGYETYPSYDKSLGNNKLRNSFEGNSGKQLGEWLWR